MRKKELPSIETLQREENHFYRTGGSEGPILPEPTTTAGQALRDKYRKGVDTRFLQQMIDWVEEGSIR